MMESDAALKGNRILISGLVVDETGDPLEGISIQLTEYPEDKGRAFSPTNTVISSTDGKGCFTIYAEGSEEAMHCYVRADDPDGIYESQTKTILVTWSGPTYDNDAKMFVVNDCNFIMQKKQ